MEIKNKIMLFVLVLIIALNLSAQSDSSYQNKSEWEAFPIVNYDSDVGFGYGAKGFLYNFLNGRESFDLTLYNSTKGERWYRFVFSMVDMQRRQGTKYPLAIDIIMDYDKWINANYYVNSFPSSNEKVISYIYKKELLEITAILSKGLTDDFVGELGMCFKDYNGFGFNPSENLYKINQNQLVDVSQHFQTASLQFNCRWDTRNDFKNPQKGIVLEIDNEYNHFVLPHSAKGYFKFSFLFKSYLKIFNPNFVFANKLLLQLITDESDYLLQIPLGGNNTLRGLPQDRYLNSSAALINSEFRFPIWWKLGGVAGVDIGKGNRTPDWIFNPVAGLRFYMDNFVVRFDVGFSKETTGLYFNFGHMF